MNKEQAKPGLLERGANFAERLNKFLGTTALVGAGVAYFVAPEAFVPLAAFGVLQFAENEIIWKSLKHRKQKTQTVPAI